MKKISTFLLILSLFPGIFTGIFFTNYILKPDFIGAVDLMIKDTGTLEQHYIAEKSRANPLSAVKAIIDRIGDISLVALISLFVPGIVSLVVMGLGFQFSRFLFNLFLINEKDYVGKLVIMNIAGLLIGFFGRIIYQFL